MSTTTEVLFALTRQDFTPFDRTRVEDISRRSAVDWASLAARAAAEGVTPIVGVNLGTCDAAATRVPAAVTERLQCALLENVAVKMQRHRQLVAGLAHFDMRGYDVLLLKSAAFEASGVYQHPWVTCARDIDLVLRRRDSAAIAPDEWAVRAVSRDRGIECEIHGHHDVSMYGLVPVSFANIWRDARPISFNDAGSTPAFVMCPEDMLFTLCVNACRQSYLRLKTLFDIVETVRRYPALDWTSFEARARESDSCGIAFTALCAADETIGLPKTAARYPRLLPSKRADLLRMLVRRLAASDARHRLGRLALLYASFNRQQRWGSAHRTAMQWPSRQMTARDRVDAALPGEQ
jgi:hypothetical protein